MTLNSGILWQIILEKYPDGVDVQAVGQKTVIETTLDLTADSTWGNGDQDPYSYPTVVENIIQLTEIEPETGIYTAMSDKTHRVYVYVDIAEHGVF